VVTSKPGCTRTTHPLGKVTSMGCTCDGGEAEVRGVADAMLDDRDDTTWTGRKRGSSGSAEAGSPEIARRKLTDMAEAAWWFP
jgi:hypothetical protein